MRFAVRILSLYSLLTLLLFTSIVTATTIRIPQDQPTIQEGIDAGITGDTVLVAPGTYVENINFNGKNLVVGSWFLTTGDTAYISQTVIDGNQSGSVVTFKNGENSSAVLTGFTITNGDANRGGGILCLYNSSPSLANLTISENYTDHYGGGISCWGNSWRNSSPILSNVTISGNISNNSGGGIYILYSSPSFDTENRCNIYLNSALSWGNDLYAVNSPIIPVVLDTFTVMTPNNYHAFPLDDFTFDILNAKVEQVNADLYVSPEGDDANSGLAPSDPLQTIFVALTKILADSLNPHTIYLAQGVYGDSTSGEKFPLNMLSYVSLSGESEDDVILDAEGERRVLSFDQAQGITVENLTITGGGPTTYSGGGGVYSKNSTPSLSNVTISGNTSNSSGGGGYFYNSSPILSKVTITHNTTDGSGGGIYFNNSSPSLSNVTISGNTSNSSGGGGYFYNSSPILSKVTITHNTTDGSGGGIYFNNSSPSFDIENRCNIYLNSTSSLGNDLYSDNLTTIPVVLDTFTVMTPTNYHAFPLDNFTFDILNSEVEQVNADLYVSPEGDNANSGLSLADPLQTIFVAFTKILADSLNPHTIYLAQGVYSNSTSGDYFPLNMLSYISLSGESEEDVILDAEGESRVLSFDQAQGITVENLTITGGSGKYGGGGIYLSYSNPNLVNVTINGNTAYDIREDFVGDGYGGGIYCDNSSPVLYNVTISNNVAEASGGGIYLLNSSPTLTNVTITNNTTDWAGGGIYFNNSSPSLSNVTISGNTSNSSGGGIFFYCSSPILSNVTITNNTTNTTDGVGGGICFRNSSPSFDSENRCNIYFNSANSLGNDLYDYSSSSTIAVVVDTFTVMTPTNYHSFPVDNFTFDILNAKVEQANANLYVSPDGDDANSGLSPSEALQTISTALTKILADSLNPHTIYLSDGVYSPSTSGENFPLNMLSYVSLSGESEEGVILDAEGESRVLSFNQAQEITVENLTITGGGPTAHLSRGGGIYSKYSTPSLSNVTINGNTAFSGAGILLNNSSLSMSNVTITNNTVESGVGGGIYLDNSSASLANVTVSRNTGSYDGGIFCQNNSHLVLANTILWNDSPHEIYFFGVGDPNSLTIAYSDVEGGEEGIVTSDNGSVNWLDGNIDAAPLFIDADDGDFHLQEGSPCIDAGTAFFVWEGDTLVDLTPEDYVGSAPDMGAFEYVAVSIAQSEDLLPEKFALHQNYPNPFNPVTTLRYNLPERSEVMLTIYDILGRRVRTLVQGVEEPGHKSVMWDGTNNLGQQVSAGVYLYRIQAGDFTQTRKMIVLK